jgi:hypothetical protein
LKHEGLGEQIGTFIRRREDRRASVMEAVPREEILDFIKKSQSLFRRCERTNVQRSSNVREPASRSTPLSSKNCFIDMAKAARVCIRCLTDQPDGDCVVSQIERVHPKERKLYFN